MKDKQRDSRGIKVIIWLIFLALPALVVFNLESYKIPIGFGYFLLGIFCTFPAITLSTIFSKKSLRLATIIAGILISVIINMSILEYTIA